MPEEPDGANSSATEAEVETMEPTAKMAADLPKSTILKTTSSSTSPQVPIPSLHSQLIQLLKLNFHTKMNNYGIDVLTI